MAEHTEYLDVCRICLAMDLRMKNIADTPLQQVFERLTNISLHTSDQRPVAMCYMCHALLRKCHQLSITAARAENVLSDILKPNKVTKASLSQVDRRANNLCGTLAVSQTKYFVIDIGSSIPEVEVEVKMETDWEQELEIKEEPLDPMDYVSPELPHIAEADIKNEPDEEFPDKKVVSDSGQIPGKDLKELKEDDAGKTGPKGRASRKPKQKKPRKEVAGTRKYAATQIPKPEKRKKSDTAKEKQQPRNPTEIHEGRHECHICTSVQNYPEKQLTGTSVSDARDLNRLYPCDICQIRFKRPADLKKHLAGHTYEKPHHCNICTLSFKKRTHLTYHLKSHSSEKPHVC